MAAPATRQLLQSFSGGEVSPEFYGRIGDAKFQSGLALCSNFIVLPHGPVVNRPGTTFVREVKSVNFARLIPFAYSADQTMVLEFGPSYIRFHTQGATLLDGGVPYEVVTPYGGSDLAQINYVQSNDVMTLVHPLYPPGELRRLGPLNWTYTAITFGAYLGPPEDMDGTAFAPGGGTPIDHKYVAVSVGLDGGDRSLQSGVATVSNDLNVVGAYNTVTWTAPGGPVALYDVFKLSNGLYGYIGTTAETSFVDNNITPDLSNTPQQSANPFVGAGNYPAATSYYEQRRAFGGTTNQPQNMWLTRSATETNLNYSIPSRDDDAISFRIAAREVNTIRHIVPMDSLIVLTNSAEFAVQSTANALTPSTLSVKPQSYIGANFATPVVVNNNLIFAAARGGHLREFAYAQDAKGYLTGDLCLRASHLFDHFDIRDMAYAKSPYPIVWATSTSGKLLGLTYVPEQGVGAFHQHTTVMGQFTSCCVVAEGLEDVLYVIVRRMFGGGDTRRWVERFASRRLDDDGFGFFVDAGVAYDGVPATVFSSGLTHLEGRTVAILADGAVQSPQVVIGGTITLEQPAGRVVVGLPIVADLQTLPAAFQIDGGGQGRTKNVNAAWLRVFESKGFKVGPRQNKLTEAKIRTTETFGSPPLNRTGEVDVTIGPTWSNDGGQVYVRQDMPLPLTLVALTLEVVIGG